ncbi:MAG: hypothetical protein KAR45_17730, partial [Desulfobacteraceae bacterium]|nr:hypothetical protein [Desulfobacteraceae bacterium]
MLRSNKHNGVSIDKKDKEDKEQVIKKTGFVSLRYRFIFITSIMLLALLSTLALILGMLQTKTIR